MDLPVERIPTLVAGLGTLSFGAVVLGMSPRSQLHRAFALFCLLRGGMLGLQAYSNPITDLAGRMSVYLLLAIPFAAVWLAHTFLRRDRRAQPADVRLAAGLIAGAIVVEALYLYDHDLFFAPSGPLQYFFTFQFVCYAALALVVAHMYRGCPPGPRRRALYPLVIALGAEPLYWATFNTYPWLTDLRGTDAVHALMLTSILVLSGATGWRLAFRMGGWQDRLDRWRFLSVYALAAGSGVGTTVAALQGAARIGPIPIFFLLNAFWTLVLVAATSYAIVRYRLFSIDLRVKTFIRYGSLAVVEGAIFVIISNWLENRVPFDGGAAVLAALAIAAALYPVSRLTRRLSDRVMPGVADTDEYRARRRRDIYRAALQQALLDGFLTNEEKAALDTLWKSLGLSGKEALEMEREARPA